MHVNREPFGSESIETLTVWKIALGVCIGVLVANAITWVAAEVRLRWEVNAASATIAEQTAKVKQAAVQAQQEAESARQQAVRQQELAAAERRRQLAELERADNERRRVQLEEASKREAAWRRFYKPSPGCVEANLSVECANEHIRAKRAFDARYASTAQ